MSRLFGPVFQVVYAVADLDAALAHWTGTLGVGPFFRFPLPLAATRLTIDGQDVPGDTPIFAEVAMAFSGSLMIELIEPGPAPSPYADFLAAGRHGVHHLGTVAHDYDAQLAAARAAGIRVLMEGVMPVTRFACLETDAVWPGTRVELVEITPALAAVHAMAREAAAAWDGRDPVRSF